MRVNTDPDMATIISSKVTNVDGLPYFRKLWLRRSRRGLIRHSLPTHTDGDRVQNPVLWLTEAGSKQKWPSPVKLRRGLLLLTELSICAEA
jgi:hypothetical protein